jgi:hypothetical protein
MLTNTATDEYHFPMVPKPNAAKLPRFIALVGNPKAGKSLVQDILRDNYGVAAIDSGGPLRQIAMQQYGLTHDQVYTQEGKLEYVEVLGRRWQVRELLGELGNRFEKMHGDWATPWMAVRQIPAADDRTFCDASCRKTQGNFYKSLGGVVIGIHNPLAGPSPYAFDAVRTDIPDYWIENDALARGMSHVSAKLDLELKVQEAVNWMRGGS